MKIQKVALFIACHADDTDVIINEFYESRLANVGVCCIGHEVYDLTPDEMDMIQKMNEEER